VSHPDGNYQVHRTEAVGSDGPAMIRVARQNLSVYLIPTQRFDRTRIVLPTSGRTFEIAETLKEFRELGGLWRFSEGWDGDPECVRKASQVGLPIDSYRPLGPFRKTGAELSVAGVRAIEYGFALKSGRLSETMALGSFAGVYPRRVYAYQTKLGWRDDSEVSIEALVNNARRTGLNAVHGSS